MDDVIVRKRGEGRRYAMEDGTAVALDQVEDPWMTLEVMTESDLLESLYYELEPGATTGEVSVHDGQEIHCVVAGELEYTCGDRKIELGPGDVIWHRSERPHMVKNVGTTRATVFLVNLPPSFKW